MLTRSISQAYSITDFPQDTIAMLAQNEALIYKAEKYRFINFATVYYNENSATQTIKFFDRYNLIIVRSTYSLSLSGG